MRRAVLRVAVATTAAGVALAHAGLLVLLAAIVIGLTQLGVTAWLSAAIVGFGTIGIGYLLATVLAVEITILHHFVWHECFTWSDRAAGGADRRSSTRRWATTGLPQTND